MSNKTIIAVDAMVGENSPKKILEGIEISLKKNQNNFFQLYGKEEISTNSINKGITYLILLNTLSTLLTASTVGLKIIVPIVTPLIDSVRGTTPGGKSPPSAK